MQIVKNAGISNYYVPNISQRHLMGTNNKVICM